MNLSKQINNIEEWFFNHTYTNLIFNYNIKKRDITSLLLWIYIFITFCLMGAIITGATTIVILLVTILLLSFLFIKIHYRKIIFQFKFYRYFEKLLLTRTRNEDIAKLKNPTIFISFKKGIVKLEFQSLGYFSVKEYEDIANSIADMLDMEKSNRIYKNKYNYTILEFIPKDTPINMNDKSNSEHIRLSQNISWDIYKIPHSMIIGITGSGKSMMISHILSEVERLNFNYLISDIKNETDFKYRSDTSFTNSIPGTLKILRELNEELDKRINYESNSSKHIFFIFEEFLAFQQLLDSKEKKEFESNFNRLLVLGRSSNIHLVIALQNPDAKNFGSSSFRSNFGLIIHLGKMTQERAQMTFGVSKNDLPLHTGKEQIGEGYIQYGDIIKTYVSPRIQ